MKIGFLITARLKSSRLPLKLLLDLNGRSLIERVVDRARSVQLCDEVVLCTSVRHQDLPLLRLARGAGVDYFAGSPDDVLARLLDAAELFGIDVILGATADNPLFSIYHADLVANLARSEPDLDFIWTTGLPLGTNVYGIRTRALRTVCEVKNTVETEIWGDWLRQPEIFNVREIEVAPQYQRNYRLTLDEPEDQQLFHELFHRFARGQVVDVLDAFRELDRDPDLAAVNAGIVQRDLDSESRAQIRAIFEDSRDHVLRVKQRIYGAR